MPNTVPETAPKQSRLEPNPQAVQRGTSEPVTETAAPVATATQAGATAPPEAPPAQPVAVAQEPQAATQPEAKAQKGAKAKAGKIRKGPVVELGAGYKIACKSGTGYATFYEVVAKHGHFEEVAQALEAGKVNVSDKAQADDLLSKMFVPSDKLEGFCRQHSNWKKYAEKRTKQLLLEAKKGTQKHKKAAQSVLGNLKRCGEDGAWTGNIPEMVSTCVGYYNFLYKPRKGSKAKKPNKNVMKFKEAGVLFRRYPLSRTKDPVFVMMFPEKFADAVRTAIVTSRGEIEESPKAAKAKKSPKAKK